MGEKKFKEFTSKWNLCKFDVISPLLWYEGRHHHIQHEGVANEDDEDWDEQWHYQDQQEERSVRICTVYGMWMRKYYILESELEYVVV